MKKLYLLIGILLFMFVIFLIIMFIPKDYVNTYKLNSIIITESFQKDTSTYHIHLKYKDLTYPLIIEKKYNYKRNFIKDVNIYEEDNTVCLKVRYLNEVYPICSVEDELVDFRLVNNEFFKKYFKDYNINIFYEKKSFENIDIYNVNNNTLYLWNYKGFNKIENNKNEKLNIFEYDNYQNNLMFQTEDIIIFPDYDNKYYFNKIYYILKDDSKIYELSFNKEISYDSYFLGYYKNIFYIVDRKNKIEYAVNMKKEKIKIVGNSKENGVIYDNGWKNISLTKLVNGLYQFKVPNIYTFEIINNTLYMIIDNFQIKLTDLYITKIIYYHKDRIYFLSKDILYEYSLKDGVIKLLKYSEWNFNNNNQIFIFN